MNNDLISRSYLKNLPFERVIHTDFGDTAIPIEEIDNAPTVDVQSAIKRDVWELYQRHQSHLGTYVYGFGIELKELLNRYEITERPQGEWINQEQGAFYPIECSKCHNQPFCNDKGYVLSNFCPNCGADMRGKKIKTSSCLTNPERHEELLERHKEGENETN